ncbi:odorant receptor 67c-like [Anthonomus grandis grandis]|uniref:odorant receptor 67c-like n=1 Tax=Anthonomus grandis grandis TaxID=2921223 RepID=UPI0021669435|nr:odorant receptor 67c-like [Anthonomus grandis grandis]
MYELRKDKPFYCTLTLLNIFLWYPLNESSQYITVFFTLSGLLRCISILSGLGTLMHLVMIIKNNIDIEISEDIGDLTGFVGCMVVCLTFLFHHSRWSHLFNNILDFKHFGTPPDYGKIVKRGNFISLICLLYTIPGMLWYCFVSYMQVPECKELNVQKHLNEPCGMVNPTWLPIKDVSGTSFIVCYLFQVIGIFVYLPSAFAICIIPWEAVEVIVARINHLKGIFKEAFESDDIEYSRKKLGYCISYHQDILTMSKELSELVRITIGSTFLTAAIVIGSLGSQLLRESTPKAISFVMGYISATFFVCHAGQRLIDESLNLANFVYDSRWYEVSPKLRKELVFVLTRCQKAMCLAASAYMGSAGYVLFCIMIKTSYSYLTLLNQMV